MEYPSKSTNLPIEIIERIIDDLHDDLAALTSISQTCHALLQLSRRLLFRSIKLTPQGPPPAENFRRLLRCNPDVGHHVRELMLDIDVSLERWVPGEPNAGIENIQALTQMPFLEKLCILGGDADLDFIITSFTLLHPTLQQPVLDCIHSPSLTELSISYFDIPVTIFRSCVNLSALSIMVVEEIPELIDQAGLSSQAIDIPQLRSFKFEGWSHRFASTLVRYRDSDGYPTIRFDGLRTLIADCDDEECMQTMKDICKEVADLETFTCMVKTSREGFGGLAGWLNVSVFSTLKTFKVACNVELDEDLLWGLCKELEMFPRTGVLEILDIEINVDKIQDHRLISTRDEWGRLDVVLSHGFSRLRRVSISVIFVFYLGKLTPCHAELHKESEEISRKQFPQLWENAAVKFDFSMRMKFVA